MKDSRSSLFEEALFAPAIPDHQMIRKIGGGAYGQVWLARSVTGAYRAVKIVSREDFRLEKTFEREFEGIRRFEPMSRGHHGLVDILHVGRSYEENFYYYVMELADDRAAPPGEVDTFQYEARTLRSDIVSNMPIDVTHCAQVGAMLADALHHLHERGLSHRDVKPSNVIFVDGVAKLADIGLVAETGQQTFVGTEGFVPPEGPGTPQADIYSLGMVLYEMSTGKDRLDFPELPNLLDLSDDQDKPRWQHLNRVICRCCLPDRKKRYGSADLVRDELLQIASGQKKANPWSFRTLIGAAAILLIGALSVFFQPDSKPQSAAVAVPPRQEVPASIARPVEPLGTQEEKETSNAPSRTEDPRMIQSEPSDAWVYTVTGQELGNLREAMPVAALVDHGVDDILIEAPGYQTIPVALDERLKATDGTHVVFNLSAFPTAERSWVNSRNIVFRWDATRNLHRSKWPIGKVVFTEFLNAAMPGHESEIVCLRADTLFAGYDGSDDQLVLTDLESAQSFCRWLTQKEQSLLRHGQLYEPVTSPVFAGPARDEPLRQLFRCQIRDTEA